MIARCKAKASEDSVHLISKTNLFVHVQAVGICLLHMAQVAQRIVRDYNQVIKVNFLGSKASAHYRICNILFELI